MSACALLALASLSGCGKGLTQAEKAAQEGILLVGNKIEPNTLDPQISTSVEVFGISFALFEGLVSPNPHTLEPEPAIAESWDISPDGLRYTFHLRSNARWSDGSAITSADFLFAWERLISPELASGNALMLLDIKGARAFNEGKSKDFSSVAVTTPDAHTLVVELENRTPWFLSILMHPSTVPIPRKSVEAAGGVFDRTNGWTRSADMLCNGPFVMTSWEPNRMIEVRRNPHYWDAQKVSLNAVRFLPIESINTEEMAYRGGQLHVTQSVPINRISQLRAQGDKALRISPYLGVYYYIANTSRAPLDNPDVRKALSLAIDRKILTEKLLADAQNPAESFTPKGIRGYEAPSAVSHDAEKARELLGKAGYAKGEDFPRIELLFNTSENQRKIAEAIQAMWKEELGIEVLLRNEDFSSYVATRNSGSFDLARGSWVADYPSAASFLDLWRSGSANNFARWSSADYDRLMNAATNAGSEAERNALYSEAERLLLDNAVVIPIYHYNSARMISTTVQGWHDNLMDWHPYKYISLKAE